MLITKVVAIIALIVGPLLTGFIVPAIIVDRWFWNFEPRPRPLQSFLAVTAFTYRELIKGLYLGLEQPDNSLWDQFWLTFFVKLFMSFCMGLGLVWCNRYPHGRRMALLYVALFTVVTPLGIILGTVLGESHRVDPLYNAISRAMRILIVMTLCYGVLPGGQVARNVLQF